MLHFSLKCEKNWKEIERLSGVHHFNLSNNELFRSPLLQDSFERRSIYFWRHWLPHFLVGSSFNWPTLPIAFFRWCPVFLDLLGNWIVKGLNIFWKDVSPVVNVIVHSCQKLILEATYSLGLLLLHEKPGLLQKFNLSRSLVFWRQVAWIVGISYFSSLRI